MVKTHKIPINVMCCEKCTALGHFSRVGGYGGTPMMYTISPDPEKYHYDEMDPDDQKKLLDTVVKQMLEKFRKKYVVKYASVHYEFNRASNLHIHGLIWIHSQYEGCPVHCARLSKIIHSICGRQYCRSTVAGHVEWTKDDDVYKYVNKENAYSPVHIGLNIIIENDKEVYYNYDCSVRYN